MDNKIKDFIEFMPEVDDKKDYKIAIIKSGLTRDEQRYYTSRALRTAAEEGLYDNAKMYLNHQLNPNELHRDVKDYVGTILPQSVYYDEEDSTVYGVAHFHSELVEDLLKDDIARTQIGISQSISGIAESAKMFGKTITSIDKITDVWSVDIVPTGNAYGVFMENYKKDEVDKMDYSKISLDELKVERKDLVEALQSEIMESLKEDIDKQVEAKLDEAVSNKIAEVQNKMIEEATKNDLIKKLFDEAELPEISKNKLMESLDTDVENLEEVVKAIIAKEVEYINSIKESFSKNVLVNSEPVQKDSNKSYDEVMKDFLKKNNFSEVDLQKMFKEQ